MRMQNNHVQGIGQTPEISVYAHDQDVWLLRPELQAIGPLFDACSHLSPPPETS
jgi:hypothetical protein